MKIPMLDLKAEYLYMKEGIDAAIARCLEHQQWIFGPEVKEFEEKVAEYIGVGHCIGTSSGTDALVLALRALAIKTKSQQFFDRSDIIVTTPFTFTATGDAILRAGATPLFVDIDPVTYNIDPSKIREALDSPNTALHSSHVVGILPVHLYGQSCQMDEIMSIAQEYNLFVVEDCAQAFGGSWKDNKLGSIGNAGAFSFFPSKNLGGFGDAGAVTTNDDELDGLVRMLLMHGGKNKYNVDHIGYNARLDTLQAAILLAKLKHIDDFNNRRCHIAQLYIKGLKDINDIVVPISFAPHSVFRCNHVFHQFTIRILEGKRDFLQTRLKGVGIDSMVYYPVLLHKMKMFSERCVICSKLCEAIKACGEVLSLPIEPIMVDEHVKHVINSIYEINLVHRITLVEKDYQTQ